MCSYNALVWEVSSWGMEQITHARLGLSESDFVPYLYKCIYTLLFFVQVTSKHKRRATLRSFLTNTGQMWYTASTHWWWRRTWCRRSRCRSWACRPCRGSSLRRNPRMCCPSRPCRRLRGRRVCWADGVTTTLSASVYEDTTIIKGINVSSCEIRHWCDTGMTLMWHWYDTGMTLMWHWYDTDVTLVWHWCDTGMTLVWHWYDTDVTLVWHW